MSIASRSKARNVASAHLKNCLLKIRSEVPKKHIMDWDPSESTEIYETNDRNSQVVSFFGPFEPTEIYNNCIDLRLNQLIVAVDTNIFISSLQIVNRLLDPSIVKEDPIILVPLQVLQELDGLKNRRSEDIMLSSKAQLAIKFINEKLLKSELIGEQYSTNYPYENLSADDRIIQSCLKYKRKHRILLLTNDVNLQNKALINDIQAFNDKSILENLCVAKECEMDESYSLKHKPKMKEFRSCEYSLSKSISKKPVTSSNNFYYGLISKVDKTLLLFLEPFICKIIDNRFYDGGKEFGVTKLPWTVQQCYGYLNRFWDSIFCQYIDRHGHLLINQLIKLRNAMEKLRKLTMVDVRNYNEKCVSLLNSFNNKKNSEFIERFNNCKHKLQSYLRPGRLQNKD